MTFLTGSWLLDLILFAAGLLLLLSYLYVTRHFSFWKMLGIPFIKPLPFLGNTGTLVLGSKNINDVFADAYREAGDLPFVGIFVFDSPILLIKDLDLIGSILTSNFSSFINRNFHLDDKNDPFTSKTLFGARDGRWRRLRTKLGVTFTSGKMKRMYPLVQEAGKILVQQLSEQMERDGYVDTFETTACYTTDSIGSILLGIEPAALKDKDAVVRRNLRLIMNTSLWRYIKAVIAFLSPETARMFKIKLSFTEADAWILNTVTQNVNYRKSTAFQRGDFLDILLHLEEEGHLDNNKDVKAANEDSVNGSSKEEFNFRESTMEVVGQVFAFLIAGFETSSSTMTSTLYELSMNQEVQNKLRSHINEVLVKYNGEITYEAINDMQYLDMVIAEAQRLYPPLAFLDRVTANSYKIPGTSVTLPKNTGVVIALHCIQTDPRYWDQPRCFIPERFTEEKIKERSNFLHMPFGEGPRICIGKRLGLMQVKAGLAHIIKNYEVVPHAKTPISLQMDPTRITTVPSGILHLVFKKINA